MTDVGDGLMIAGVVFQVVTLAVFGVMITDYTVRRWRGRAAEPFDTKAQRTWDDIMFRVFAVSLVTLYTAILIRCVYRIAELAGYVHFFFLTLLFSKLLPMPLLHPTNRI
jgi:hypothetical protein